MMPTFCSVSDGWFQTSRPWLPIERVSTPGTADDDRQRSGVADNRETRPGHLSAGPRRHAVEHEDAAPVQRAARHRQAAKEAGVAADRQRTAGHLHVRGRIDGVERHRC